MTDEYFTVEKVTNLILAHDWILQTEEGGFFLSQADKPYMKTGIFKLTDSELAMLRKNLNDCLFKENYYSALNEEGYRKYS